MSAESTQIVQANTNPTSEVSNTTTVHKDTPQDIEGSEWGWDHTPLESDDGYEARPLSLDASTHSTHNNSRPSPNKEQQQTPTRITPKNPNLGSSNDIKNQGSGSSTLKGMISSPSFNELEKAIGQTLALGLNTSESSNSLNSEDRRSMQRVSINRSRSFGKQQQIFRPYSNSNLMNMNVAANARSELDPYCNEYESRAIILFHNPNLNPLTVRNIAQKCGVLYYIRPEFHSRYGVTLLSYFDLRAAMLAHSNLALELGAEGNASPHFSVMLHAGAGTNSEEFRLILRNISISVAEEEVASRFSQFGELRSIQKFLSDDKDTASFSIEYYNIQDARLAASELSATISQSWGTNAEIAFAPLDGRKQTLCRQLLATLSRWRAELASSSFAPTSMMPPSYGGYPTDRSSMMMMMAQQQQQQQNYYTSPPHTPYSMSPMQPHMMYPPAEYIPQLQLDTGGVSFYPHSSPYYPPTDHLYNGWQSSNPSASPAIPKSSSSIVGSPSNQSNLLPPKMTQHSYSPVQDNRPLHHNGGHGYTRKPKNMQPNPSDAEFLLDMKKLSTESGESYDRRTTLMIRNIPNKYSQSMLLDEINIHHEGTYDFFYLPIDFKNKCNVGYAFISFLDPISVGPFVREFEGQRWNNFNSDKVCSISYARIQGKAAMISRFQNSSLLEKDDEYRPLLFFSEGPNKGKPEPFPAANRNRGASHASRPAAYESEGGDPSTY